MVEIPNCINDRISVDYDPFDGPEIERVIACTEPQVEILTSCLLGGTGANLAFNESITLTFTGLLDKAAMEIALQKLVIRHQSLRSAFSAKDLRMSIFKNLDIPLFYLDISLEEDGLTKEKIVKGYIKQDSLHLFDLVNGPLFKAGLIKIADREHCLVLTAHHIICDGWSIGIILQDLGKLYSSYVQNVFIDLPKPVLFSQFATEQIEFFKSEEYQAIEKFWLDQYSENIPVVNLPTDFPRPQLRVYQCGRLDYNLDNSLVDAVKNMATKAGCSFVTTLLAAFEILLYRLTGQDEIAIGLPAAGQSVTGHYYLVGHCVNLLPLRSNPSPGISFLEYLEKRKPAIFDAYEHQQLTFGSLLNKLKIPRDPSRIPLVPVVFNIDMGLDDGVAFHGLAYQLVSNPKAYGIFELFLNITGSENTFTLEWSYNSQLFKAATIDRMMTGFKDLLKTIIADPGIRLGDIRLLDEIDQPELANDSNVPVSGILHEFNDSGYQGERTIVEVFEEQVKNYPGNIALQFESEQLTYRQLNERSNQLAWYLQSKGVKLETLVPVCLERGSMMLIAIVGILKAGGAYVPIDPGYPAERIAFMLEDIAAGLLVSSKECRKQLPVNGNIDIVEMDGDWKVINNQPTTNISTAVQPDNLAYIIYTSGSTGKPKGVMVTQNNVVSLVKGIAYVSFTSKDILLSTGSPSFDATTFEYWGMLLNGGRLVLCAETRLLDTNQLKEEINSRGVNRMWFTAGWLNQLVDADITLFEKLETIVVGGEKLSERHIEKLRQAYPAIEIINGYGPTENTTFSLTYRITENVINKPIPIGRPLHNRNVWILDENYQVLPVGATGQIFLSGAGLSRGYLNRPELTKEKFVKNPFATGQDPMMYKSGDLGRRLPDGNIEFLGRMDDQVKIRGYRIELGEIENVLRQSGLVLGAVVLAGADNTGNSRLVCYIVPVKKFDKDAVVAYLRSKIPEYMLPSSWIELTRFPLTSNGKIDKNALTETGASRLPVNQHNMPRDKMEEKLAEIWQDLLGITTAGIHDNFFELGGHSLLAIRLSSIIRKKMEVDISTNDIFIYPTIAGLAANFSEKKRAPTLPATNIKYLVPIQTGGNKIPLYIVAGGGGTALRFIKFGKMLDPEQPVYVLQPPIDRKDLKEFPDTIEAIARTFIGEILVQNPAGPYAFSGHCLGGIIAFEMARQQLEASGKKIHLLAMFDTVIDEVKNEGPAAFKNLYHIPGVIQNSISKIILKLGFETFLLRKYTRQSLRYKMDNFKSFLKKIRPKKLNTVEAGYGGIAFFDESADVYRAACKNYKLLPYGGEIILFYAKEHYFFLDRKKNVEFKQFYLDESTKNRWKLYAADVSIYEVEGEHSEMFDPVNGDAFALALQKHLDKAGK